MRLHYHSWHPCFHGFSINLSRLRRAHPPSAIASPHARRRAYGGQGLMERAPTQVVVAAVELSHNAAGRAFSLAQRYQPWTIRTAVQKAQLPVHTFVAEHNPRTVEQAFALVDTDDEELCNACEREPIRLDGLKRLWTWLAVDLAQRFDGITVANGPLQRA